MPESAAKLAALSVCLLLIPATARAGNDAADLAMTTDGSPGICEPYLNNQRTYPGALITASGELISTPRSGGFIAWHNIDPATFRQENRAKYEALQEAGIDYTVYKSEYPGDFYGDGTRKDYYIIGYKPNLDGAQRPAELTIQEDGSTLDEGLKKLGASDVVLQGLRAFPIVIRPDRISIYEIDTDLTGQPPWDKKPFLPTMKCEFARPSGNVGSPSSIPTSSEASPLSAAPAAAAPGTSALGTPSAVAPDAPPHPVPASLPSIPVAPLNAPPNDPCAQYQSVNPSFYANCENRMNPRQ